MEFIPLSISTKPKTKPLSENPYLLDNMENNQFVHSKYSTNPIPPRLQKLKSAKKPKRIHKSPSIPFYQSSKYQDPNSSTPRPRKPFWPKTYIRKLPRSQVTMPPSSTTIPPYLITPSDSKKYLEMSKNVQPGISSQVPNDVAKVIKGARWDGLVFYLGRRYNTTRMGEFYLNMRVIKGDKGVLHFTTYVDQKTILVDHKTVNRALHLPAILCDEPCLDIYSHFMFDQNEFKSMLSTLCDSDIPVGLCEFNCAIHYKHFVPNFQILALILRANILPKPNQSKYFDFFDIKVLFLLYVNKIRFNISYVILLNMINASLVNYMPYGLLLTSLFDVFHISLPNETTFLSDSLITMAHTREPVPLIHCEPQRFMPTLVPRILCESNVFLADLSCVQVLINEQNLELKRLKDENDEIKGRLNFIENLANTTLGQTGLVDMDLVNSYQVPLVGSLEMEVEVHALGENDVNLPNLREDLGFVNDIAINDEAPL